MNIISSTVQLSSLWRSPSVTSGIFLSIKTAATMVKPAGVFSKFHSAEKTHPVLSCLKVRTTAAHYYCGGVSRKIWIREPVKKTVMEIFIRDIRWKCGKSCWDDVLWCYFIALNVSARLYFAVFLWCSSASVIPAVQGTDLNIMQGVWLYSN